MYNNKAGNYKSLFNEDKSNKNLALILSTTMASIFMASTIVFILLWRKNRNGSTPFKVPSTEAEIYIAVINDSSTVSDDVIKDYMNAIQIQITRDLFSTWGVHAILEFYDAAKTGTVPANYMEIHIVDTYDQADALGYHTVNKYGMPLALVSVQITENAGQEISLVMSHEILEMIIDPFAANSVFAQTTSTGGTIVAYEICDPCQAANHAYFINGIMVSDFVLPTWFEFYANSNRKYDFTGHISSPFVILSGGYALVFKVPNNGSGWTAITGGIFNNTSVLAAKTIRDQATANDVNLCGRVKQRMNTDPVEKFKQFKAINHHLPKMNGWRKLVQHNMP
jgi:hypothetical protein